MMKDYYTIRVISTWKILAVFLGGAILAFGMLILIDFRTLNYGDILCLVWIFACMTMGYVLLRKVAAKTLRVSLTAEKMAIQSSRAEVERVIMLDDIASYLYQDFNGNKTFRLRLHSGLKIQFGHNSTFCGADDLPALVANFKKQIASNAASTERSSKTAIQREKTFFERPIANVFGWCIAVVLVGLTGHLLLNGVKEGKWGSVCVIYGNGLAYLGAWLNTRRGAKSQ